MSNTRTILKNTTALAVGRIVAKAGSLIFLGYVTRVLGEGGFGRFSSAMALIGIVEVLPGYVARPYIVRTVSRAREKSGRFLSNVFFTNVLFSLLVFFALFAVVPLMGYQQDARTACYLLAASLLFSSLTNSYHALFAGWERMELSALTDVFNTALTLLLGLAFLVVGGGVVALAGAYASARVLSFFLARRFAAPLLKEEGGLPRPDMNRLRPMLIGAWPFFITQMFIVFYNRADVLMLSVMDSTMDKVVATGRYNAAYKLMEGLGMMTSAFVVSVYPVLAKKFMQGRRDVLVTFRQSFRVLAAFVMPVAVGTTLLATQLMGLLFGQSFAVAGGALQILIWGQVLDSLNPLAAVTLRAVGKEKDLARITGVCAVFNLGLNLVLIPRYSYMGAAAATLASFVLVYVWGFRVLRGALGPLDVAGSLLRAAAAAGVMGVVVWRAMDFGILAAVAAGVPAYILAAIVFRVVRKEEVTSAIRTITGFLRKKKGGEGGRS